MQEVLIMARFKSRCAVCGRNIEDVVRQTHGDEEYHFCCEKCRMEFLKHPDEYEAVWFNFRKEGFDTGAIKCAVCGDLVSEEVAVKQEYHDAAAQDQYWFCSEKHRIDFINDPRSYKEFSGKHMSQ
jgi:YHS domain-containing protein